jgi:hypothetical protein
VDPFVDIGIHLRLATSDESVDLPSLPDFRGASGGFCKAESDESAGRESLHQICSWILAWRSDDLLGLDVTPSIHLILKYRYGLPDCLSPSVALAHPALSA